MSTTYRNTGTNEIAVHDRTRSARSLETARPGEVLDLDLEGNVRVQNRRAGPRFLVVSALATLSLACGAIFTSGAARIVLVSLALLYVFVSGVHYFGHLARRAVTLMAMGRLTEARVLADRVLARTIVGAGFRRVALLVRARVAALSSDHLGALEHYRAVRYSTTRPTPRSMVLNVAPQIAAYEEIVTLCNLARDPESPYLVEAKALLARAPRPSGDYLVLLHDTARLMIAFTARDASLVDDAEVKAMMRYDRLASGFGVLALVGWHARQRGDDALADRAIEAELSKPAMVALETALPALHTWLQTAGTRATSKSLPCDP